AFRLRACGGEKRERRSQLSREVMNAEICAVQAEFFGGDGEVYGLQTRVRGRARLRLRRWRPVAEGEESEFFHRRASVRVIVGSAHYSSSRRRCRCYDSGLGIGVLYGCRKSVAIGADGACFEA